LVTKELALEEVAVMVSEQARILDRLTPLQIAMRAWHPGGPSLDELVQFATARHLRRAGRGVCLINDCETCSNSAAPNG
jgi:hypothetical protein